MSPLSSSNSQWLKLKQRDRKSERQEVREKGNQRERKSERQEVRETGSQRERKSERQEVRETGSRGVQGHNTGQDWVSARLGSGRG